MSAESFSRRGRPGTQIGIMRLISTWAAGLMTGH